MADPGIYPALMRQQLNSQWPRGEAEDQPKAGREAVKLFFTRKDAEIQRVERGEEGGVNTHAPGGKWDKRRLLQKAMQPDPSLI